MMDWMTRLRGDPLPWLLEESDPAVRHLALRRLLDRPDNDPEVRDAGAAAMAMDPIAGILAAQHPDGYWIKPGPGYGPKYRGTVWQLIFLDQLGAAPQHPGVQAACAYVLTHAQAPSGGFSMSARRSLAPPPDSGVIHCLNGNLLRALIGFGWIDDERVQRAITWQVASINGDPGAVFESMGTTAPGFRCAINGGLPCAWGGIKALRALARIPAARRTEPVRRAIAHGLDLLLSRDPAVADYPASAGGPPSPLWFRLGFPATYSADVLENLDTLCELDVRSDPRLDRALAFVLSRQDRQGRWQNANAYRGRTWSEIEPGGGPSKWVTLRACGVVKAMHRSEEQCIA